MGFIDLSPQTWVQQMQDAARAIVMRLYNTTLQTYQGMWQGKEDNPQGCVDRITTLGTGAAVAFQAHAASVQYLLTVLPLFNGTADMIAQAQTWQIPAGWSITFNPDGSANATPPQN